MLCNGNRVCSNWKRAGCFCCWFNSFEFCVRFCGCCDPSSLWVLLCTAGWFWVAPESYIGNLVVSPAGFSASAVRQIASICFGVVSNFIALNNIARMCSECASNVTEINQNSYGLLRKVLLCCVYTNWYLDLDFIDFPFAPLLTLCGFPVCSANTQTHTHGIRSLNIDLLPRVLQGTLTAGAKRRKISGDRRERGKINFWTRQICFFHFPVLK